MEHLAELGGRWDYRPGYFALLGDLELLIPNNPLGQIRSSWTDGQTIDTVVRDVNSTPSADGPGQNINLNGRPVIENFLIIAHVDTSGQSILSDDGNDYIYAMAGRDTVNGMGGNDYIDGGVGDDLLSGSSGNDVLWGNSGSDVIFGGEGDDFIFFDASDQFYGNSGFDIARYQQVGDHRGLVISMGEREIEVLITGNKADIVFATGEGPLLISTGGGSDKIVVENDRGSPTIVMGGSGRDTFDILMDPESTDPAGILAIRVSGLTSDNFSSLTLDMLGMPDDFDWSQIDLVVINPESSDRITLNGGLMNAPVVGGEIEYTWTDPLTGLLQTVDVGTVTQRTFQQQVITDDWTMLWDRGVVTTSSSFLNGDTFSYAPRLVTESRMVIEYLDSQGIPYIQGENADEVIYDFDLSGSIASSEWFPLGYGARAHYFEDYYVASDWLPESWFIYGGRVGGDGTITTTLTATMPADF